MERADLYKLPRYAVAFAQHRHLVFIMCPWWGHGYLRRPAAEKARVVLLVTAYLSLPLNTRCSRAPRWHGMTQPCALYTCIRSCEYPEWLNLKWPLQPPAPRFSAAFPDTVNEEAIIWPLFYQTAPWRMRVKWSSRISLWWWIAGTIECWVFSLFCLCWSRSFFWHVTGQPAFPGNLADYPMVVSLIQ